MNSIRQRLILSAGLACLAAQPLLAAGTPEQIVKCKASHTGRFLKPLLDKR